MINETPSPVPGDQLDEQSSSSAEPMPQNQEPETDEQRKLREKDEANRKEAERDWERAGKANLTSEFPPARPAVETERFEKLRKSQ